MAYRNGAVTASRSGSGSAVVGSGSGDRKKGEGESGESDEAREHCVKSESAQRLESGCCAEVERRHSAPFIPLKMRILDCFTSGPGPSDRTREHSSRGSAPLREYVVAVVSQSTT